MDKIQTWHSMFRTLIQISCSGLSLLIKFHVDLCWIPLDSFVCMFSFPMSWWVWIRTNGYCSYYLSSCLCWCYIFLKWWCVMREPKAMCFRTFFSMLFTKEARFCFGLVYLQTHLFRVDSDHGQIVSACTHTNASQ